MFCSAMPLGALLFFLRPARDTLRMCEIEMLIFLVKKKEIGSTRMSLGEKKGKPEDKESLLQYKITVCCLN